MKRKALVWGSVILTILFSMTGCKKQEEDLYSKEKPVSIRVWIYYNGKQLESFHQLVDQFNEEEGAEKGIHVESYSQGSVNDLEKNVIAAAEGKVGEQEVPNIFAAYADTAYLIDQMGLAVDLSQYLTEEEISSYVDSYMQEGKFTNEEEIKIFPIAKSLEVFLLNKTDWDKFAKETGASYDDLSTMEGLVKIAEQYYEWTDAQTEQPEDGKAFFGRDAMANYFLIGAKQLGMEIFSVKDGTMTLNFDKEIIRKLWDCYYVPFVKGYFSASGRFRSDDVKIGNIIAFVGSSSGATFFPNEVVVSDTEHYKIDVEVLPNPKFQDGEDYTVQQGAGMVVTKADEAEVQASVEFLKWFTKSEQNIRFSTESGYVPVLKEANDMAKIQENHKNMEPVMEDILSVAIDTVNSNQLYTPRAFEDGTSAREILEYSMSDLAKADRQKVVQKLEQGAALEEAVKEFVSDSYFDTWYEGVLSKLQQFQTQ